MMINISSFAFSVLTALFSSCGSTNGSSVKVEFSDTLRIKSVNAPGSIESADFNNDIFFDLAIASETDSSITILLGNGKGSFHPSPNSPFLAGAGPNDISLADFNNDANMDMAIANHER